MKKPVKIAVLMILVVGILTIAINHFYTGGLDFISLTEAHLRIPADAYPGDLSYVTVSCTEAGALLFEYSVYSERVDYHTLQPREWEFSNGKFFIREDVIDKLLEDTSKPS